MRPPAVAKWRSRERKLTCNDPNKCLQEKRKKRREKSDKVVTEVFVCVYVWEVLIVQRRFWSFSLCSFPMRTGLPLSSCQPSRLFSFLCSILSLHPAQTSVGLHSAPVGGWKHVGLDCSQLTSSRTPLLHPQNKPDTAVVAGPGVDVR